MNEPVPYIVHESILARMERTIKRLWILCIIMFTALVISNGMWLYYESQDTLAHARKNILKGDEMEEESYSGDYGRRYAYDYPDDTSYGRSYARRRDSMGRYSRRYSGDEAMLDTLRDMMESAPDERTKAEYRKFIAKMESM